MIEERNKGARKIEGRKEKQTKSKKEKKLKRRIFWKIY